MQIFELDSHSEPDFGNAQENNSECEINEMWTVCKYYRNIQHGLWCTKYQAEILGEEITQGN